jgi:hypothetical protein
MIYDKTHGSPYDRGSADAYYDRSHNPHWYPEGSYRGKRIEEADMTSEEIQAYDAGYEEETERKIW